MACCNGRDKQTVSQLDFIAAIGGRRGEVKDGSQSVTLIFVKLVMITHIDRLTLRPIYADVYMFFYVIVYMNVAKRR